MVQAEYDGTTPSGARAPDQSAVSSRMWTGRVQSGRGQVAATRSGLS